MLWKLFLFLFGLIVAIYILTNPILHQLILTVGSFGYLGGFLTGFFYTSTFTAIPAAAVFLLLSGDALNPFILSSIGGIGAMCGDYILYRIFRSGMDKITKTYIPRNRLFRLLAVIVGALIIASPFPDEAGIALLGISRLETKKFLPLSFVLNAAGIFVVVGLGKIF